ncbi:MAG: acyl-CoA dehydrogenase family protein [Actinomycetota bacterium]
MDFNLTEEQRLYRDEVIRFAQRELGEGIVDRDVEGSFDAKAWQRCAEFGIQGLPVPKAYGGQDADPLTVMLAMEGLGYGCTDNGLLFSLNAQMWACEIPILRFGTDEQKERYLPGLCDGSILAAHGMSEPGSGSDAFALGTKAEQRGESYVLNGSKTFVTNAPVADVFVVFATVDKDMGVFGLTAFLLERGDAGLEVGEPIKKMGLRTSPMSELFFNDLEIPASRMLGKRGGGMALFNSAMEWERSCILASTVGSMERQLERSVAYARERKQYGQPIGKFQAISHRIVEMKLRLETSRLLLYRLGWAMGEGKASALDSALAKLHLSESYLTSSMDALQIHGGYGYMTEYELEREVRDAFGSRLYSGTSDIQRNIAARILGL